MSGLVGLWVVVGGLWVGECVVECGWCLVLGVGWVVVAWDGVVYSVGGSRWMVVENGVVGKGE